jgi:hypothetical protein
MYGFWIRFPSLTGSFSLFYNAKAELLPFTVKKKLVADLIRNSSLDIEPQADHPKDETYNEDFPDALNCSQLGKKHRRGKHPMKSMFK